MKRLGRAITALILLPLCLALTGCSGLDYMIEEYNSRFGIHDDSVLLPGDPGYDEKDMLEEEYHVYRVGVDNHTLNISAPRVDGASYRWELYKDDQLVQQDYDSSHHTFQLLSLPEVDTYQLRLTLTVDGKEYKDTALVTVHTEQVAI